MEHPYRDVLVQMDLAWPAGCLAAAEVDFVRDPGGLPEPLIEPDGTLFVTLRSLVWDTRQTVRLGRPMTERERLAAPQRVAAWGWSGRKIADAMDDAVARLREPPPFYVEGP